MNDRIPCEIITDLLPLYAEKLTSEVTGKTIETHLEQCGDCRNRYEKLKTPVEPIPVVQGGELDYLRKIRRTNRSRVGAGMLLTAVLLAGILLLRLFLLGHPTESYTTTTAVVGDEIVVQGSFTDSNSVYARSKLISDHGVTELVVYACLPSFWNRSGSFELRYPKGKELVVNGARINKEGTVITKQARELYAEKNPYIGDMSANGRLAITLNIAGTLGNFKNSLQTKVQPYGWTLEFVDPVAPTEEAKLNEQMKAYSYVLLAMIDNLGEISWTYQSDGQTVEQRITAAQASEAMAEEIKNYSVSEEKVQELLDAAGIR